MTLGCPDPAALVARIERRADELARALVRSWREQLPDTPPPTRSDAVGSVGTVLAVIRGDEFASQPTVERTATYGICARLVLEALREEAGPQEQAELAEAASRLLIANARMSTDLLSAYQNEKHEPRQPRGQASAHRALVRDLLAGITPTRPTLLAESGLADGIVVLGMAFAADDHLENADSADPAADSASADVQRMLDRHYGHAVPMLVEVDGGYALLPRALLPEPEGPGLDEIAARIGEVRPSAKVAAAAAPTPAEVGTAARRASEVLRLAGRLGRPPGAYRLADVLIEYHVTRHDESAALLEALLAPLDERPELLETLRVYLEENYDRRRAAHRLSLHPNTVDNRLARTTELTGLDPGTPRGVTILMTALALRDLG